MFEGCFFLVLDGEGAFGSEAGHRGRFRAQLRCSVEVCSIPDVLTWDDFPLRECLLQVGDKVSSMFQSDAEADESGAVSLLDARTVGVGHDDRGGTSP